MIDREAENDCLLGFAHNGNVTARFMNSLLGAFSEDARRAAAGGTRRLVEYNDAQGPYIHDNRARIARYFLEFTDYQWLFMVDNDIEFPPDSLYRLLDAAEEHDCKLIGGAYWNQYSGTGRYLSWLVFTERGIRAVPKLPDSDAPVEVTALGMGCTLLHRDLLQDVVNLYGDGDPWDTFGADILVSFEDGGFAAGRNMDEFHDALAGGRAVKKIERMGEDVTLSLRARRAGHSAYGLPSLVVDHYKQHRLERGPMSVEDPTEPPTEPPAHMAHGRMDQAEKAVR